MKADFLFKDYTVTTDIKIIIAEQYKQEMVDIVVDHHPILNRLRRLINKPVIGRDTIQVPGKLIPPVLSMVVDYDMHRMLSEKIRTYHTVDDKFDIKIDNDVYVGCFPICIEDDGAISFSVDVHMTKGQYDIYEWSRD